MSIFCDMLVGIEMLQGGAVLVADLVWCRKGRHQMSTDTHMEIAELAVFELLSCTVCPFKVRCVVLT